MIVIRESRIDRLIPVSTSRQSTHIRLISCCRYAHKHVMLFAAPSGALIDSEVGANSGAETLIPVSLNAFQRRRSMGLTIEIPDSR